MTDEQILSIDAPGVWSYSDKHKIQYARDILAAHEAELKAAGIVKAQWLVCEECDGFGSWTFEQGDKCRFCTNGKVLEEVRE